MDHINEYVLLVVAGVGTVLWFFIRQRWDSQDASIKALREALAKEVELLWEKHHEDASKLNDLELHVAREHYVRTELDQRFDRLDTTFREGFREMTTEFRALSSVLIKHISDETHAK